MILLVLTALLQADAPLRTLDRGSQSNVDTARQATARTAAELSALWQLHAPGRPLPAVDFDREIVVGVFLGSRPTAGFSVEIVSAQRDGQTLVVRYRETRPPRDSIVAQVITSPYHLAAVPRTGEVRFEKVEEK